MKCGIIEQMERPVDPERTNATNLLRSVVLGQGKETAELLEVVYDELRRLAGGYLSAGTG